MPPGPCLLESARIQRRIIMRFVTLIAAFLLVTQLARPADENSSREEALKRWKANDVHRPVPRVVTPGAPSTQDKPGMPPADATVLFDGSDLSKWLDNKGGPA